MDLGTLTICVVSFCYSAWGFVDVRDVARAHLVCMTDPKAEVSLVGCLWSVVVCFTHHQTLNTMFICGFLSGSSPLL